MAQLLRLRSGPGIGILLERLNEWQLENPDATVESCQEWALSTLLPFTQSEEYERLITLKKSKSI